MCIRDRSYAIHDIESVFEALTAEASNNAFVVRGQTRTDLAPGSIINRRYKGDDASILDTPSQLIPVDPVSYTHLDVYKRQRWR